MKQTATALIVHDSYDSFKDRNALQLDFFGAKNPGRPQKLHKYTG